MTIFFTSDTHFGHKNIIEYEKRPFTDTSEMDEEIIRRWNSRVRPADYVFHLGDFALTSKEKAKETCSRLHGNKILIIGNHDRSAKSMMEIGFSLACKEMIYPIIFNGLTREIYLSHIPYKNEYYLNLHGHLHGKIKRNEMAINVGVDAWDFYPVSLDELELLILI